MMSVENAMSNPGIFGQFDEAMEKFHRDSCEFTLFFNAVGFWLNREIDEVNSNSSEQSIEGVIRRALIGKTGVRKLLTEPTFELTSNHGCKGFVRLSLLTSSIETEIHGPQPVQDEAIQNLNFRLKNLEGSAKAFRLEMKNGNSVEDELLAEDVAQIVVEAVVRGHFV